MNNSEKKTPRVSEDLHALLGVSGSNGLTVAQILHALRGRGVPLVICVLCFPFLFPVAIPGLSIPLGIAIFLCGLRIAIGGEPRLPSFILKKHISHKLLEKIVKFGCKFYRQIEKISRPRMFFLQRWPGMINLIGGTIALAAVLLSLPIPPPFPLTNTIPGLAIILLSLGLLERDGVLIIGGYVLVLTGLCYVLAIALLGKTMVNGFMNWMGSAG